MSYEIVDDRTPAEKVATVGFMVATDRFMSGWGQAPGRSLVAVPVTSSEDLDAVRHVLESRPEMLRVRFCLASYRPRLYDGDHLHIYNTQTSFRNTHKED